jgi:hypothetical protein
VQQAPFESIEECAEADKYDLIASNIPFGDFMVYDRAYTKGKTLSRKNPHAPYTITLATIYY